MSLAYLKEIRKQAQEARELTGVLKDFFEKEHEECYKAFLALKFNSNIETFMTVQARVSALTDLETHLLSFIEQEELTHYYTKGGDNAR